MRVIQFILEQEKILKNVNNALPRVAEDFKNKELEGENNDRHF